MMGGGKYRFKELIDENILEIGDGYRAKNDELGGSGPIFLRAAYLQDTGFIADTPERFIINDPRKFGPKIAQFGDVVITTKGNSTGRIGVIRSSQVGSIYSPHLSYWRSKRHDVLDQKYLLYWAKSDIFLGQLRGLAYSTDMAPYLSLRDQLALNIQLPPIAEQRAIASVLGALDDKIELNRRMNETLERQARAIFRDWFVDFGPTRAKQEGREPYLAPEIWSLFPDRLDADGKPEGWEVAKVSDIGQVICGKTPSTSVREYYGSDRPFITIPDMHGKIFALHTSKMLSTFGANSQLKKSLPANSICVSCIASPGLVVITTEISQTNQQINSVVPSDKDELFYWYWTLRDLGEMIKQGGSGGSVLSNLSTGRFKELDALFASREVRRIYNDTVSSFFARILHNERESATLAQMRDLLLPKLMSGQIRVRDAEKAMEDVA